MSSVFVTASLVVLGTICFNVIRWIFRRWRSHGTFQRLGIPGPTPRFLDGHLSQLKATPTPNEVISSWLQKYGNVFGYFVGSEAYLVINDLELLKQVLVKDFQFFPNRPDMYLDIKPLKHTILALTDQRWKDVRRILTPTFSSSKIKLMSKIMNEKVDTTLEVVEQYSSRDEMFDMYRVMQGLTLDVIADCALAMKVNCQKDPNDAFLDAVQKFFHYGHNKVLEFAVMFPFVSTILSFIAKFITSGKMSTMIVSNIEEVIKYRRAHPEFRKMDLLQLMLDSIESGAPDLKKSSIHLTDDELIANAYVFVLAGYETTGTALAFVFWLLIQHPEIQEKVYNEICDKCTEDELSYECIQNMQYLDQVFSESLRIYPPVTGFVTRKCSKDCSIGDYKVPKDVHIYAPVWDIHHNPDLWPDPWNFDPDRFAPDNKTNIQNISFLSFGIGPRSCVGIRFAQFEAKIALAKLIRKYKFVACEKTDNDMNLVVHTVIINPAKGVYLKAIPRS